MTAIINAELVLHDCYMPDAYLTYDDGKITSFGRMRDFKA